MNKNEFMRGVFQLVNEITDNADTYISGIILDDEKIKSRMKILAHIQAVVMQSLQANNKKRAVKYAAAYYCLLKNDDLDKMGLKERITVKFAGTTANRDSGIQANPH